MKNQINNIAVKPKNELEEKVIIKLFESLGFESKPDFLIKSGDEDCIGLDKGFFGRWWSDDVKKIITLDEFIWGYCAPSDVFNFCFYDSSKNQLAWTTCDHYKGGNLISTRPKKNNNGYRRLGRWLFGVMAVMRLYSMSQIHMAASSLEVREVFTGC